MDKSDIDKLQRQALGAYLDAIERGSGVAMAKEGLAVVEGIVEAWLRIKQKPLATVAMSTRGSRVYLYDNMTIDYLKNSQKSM